MANVTKWIASLFLGMSVSLSMVLSAATDWVEFPGDPIYSPYPSSSLREDYFPFVIFNQNQFDGHGAGVLYKMWHQGPNGIALSYSNDGANWTLEGQVVLDPSIAPRIPLHASVIYDSTGFGGTPYFYKMWYWTGVVSFVPPNLAIKFTQSADGVTWTTPVITTQDTTSFLANVGLPGQPFYQFYGFGTVLYNPSATSIPGQPLTFPYAAYFDSSAAERGSQTTEEAVALAYSSDGLFWTRYGSEPVLLPSGSTADWDGKYTYRASVFLLNGVYQMYFSGSSKINNPNHSFAYTFGIGSATSSDGINWVQDPNNPIFTINDPGEAWRSGRTLAPSVVIGAPIQGNCPCCLSPQLQMWFSGGLNNGGNFLTIAIGYATLTLPGNSGGDRMWLKNKGKL